MNLINIKIKNQSNNQIIAIVAIFIYFFNSNVNAESNEQIHHVYVDPTTSDNIFEGFGVSLCWWANMCGNWNDENIDKIIDWLISPDGLNYRIFRYNIGGGDDLENKNCTPHHMTEGKGIRAEMEGFKDSPDAQYDWTRDAAQRKILLKIKEKRPDAIFEAFSNSCPWWMTYSGCSAGNFDNNADNLKPEYYEEFARYLIDVCRHYKEEYGIEFKTIAPFNEPEWAGWIANGSQEGCNFNVDSQIEFIKILVNEMEKSGINIGIAAPDLSFSSLYKKDFEAYEKAGIIEFIDKWNVHTYDVKTSHRTQIDMLCQKHNIPICVSETGPLWQDIQPGSRKGIMGNLYMAKRLIDDLKYLRPSSWLDWQYIDESDQWCLVKAPDYSENNYERVKNYYVRAHFSKFIKPGYSFVTSLNENSLAAHNPDKDQLVIVTVNTDSIPIRYTADLSMYDHIGYDCKGVITSETENLKVFNDFLISDRILKFTIPGRSIITYTIPVRTKEISTEDEIDSGNYLIYPRLAEGLVLESTDNGVCLNNPSLTTNQKWNISVDDTGILLKNQESLLITKSESGNVTLDHQDKSKFQSFSILPVDDKYFQIIDTSSNECLMMENYTVSQETKIIFSKSTNSTPTNTHWGCIKLQNNISNSTQDIANNEDIIEIVCS